MRSIGTRCWKKRRWQSKKAVNDAGRHRHRRKISTERRTNSRAGAEGTGWEQCEQATA